MTNKYNGRQLLTQTFTWINPSLSRRNLAQSLQVIDGRLYITMRFQYADKLNGNDRYYPYKTLKKAIEQFQPMIDARLAYCEADHPDSDIISVQEIAALITKIEWRGKQVLGTIQILSNTLGDNIKKVLVDDGGSISISSRGLGSLKRTDKGDQVQDDFQLTTWDLVIQPSTPNATFWGEEAIHQDLQSQPQKFTISQVKQDQELTTQDVQQILNQLNYFQPQITDIDKKVNKLLQTKTKVNQKTYQYIQEILNVFKNNIEE